MRRAIVLTCLLPIACVLPATHVEAAEGPRCHGKVATIVGTDGSDEIVGTSKRDVIVGGKGDDNIDGRGGADVICGQGGGDELRGGRGDDVLDGGEDRLYWDGKFGRAMYGDNLVPGAGDDTLHLGWDRRHRQYDGGADSVRFGGARGVTVRLGDPGRWGTVKGEGQDRILGQPLIEIHGTNHDDVIVGADSDDTLIGNKGDDRLVGGAGDDRLADRVYSEMDRPSGTDLLDGGSGNDSLQSGAGPDRLLGGDGDDGLTSSPGACVDHDGGEGQDTLTLEVPGGLLVFDGGASRDSGSALCGSTTAFEKVVLDGGTVSYRGTEGPDHVVAVTATTVTASLLGGDDTILTGFGDDVIDAGAGIDTVNAHDGVDVCDNAETAHNCESGANLPVPTCDGRVATIVVTRSSSTWPLVAPVTGTSGDDVILGSEYDDVIDGGSGHDIVCGGGGSDTLTGGDGDDRLFGGLDAYVRIDWMDPYMSGDTLVPGPGNDYLDGGWDGDQLIYASGTTDTLDFSTSQHPITADLVAGTVTGQGTDIVKSVPRQRLIATAHGDRITTGSSDDQILAGDGADVVDSGAGDDWVSTAEGGDTVATGAGDDRVYAGRGAGPVSIDTGAGDDSVKAHSGAELDGGAGTDRIEFTAEPVRGAVTMHAGAGTLKDAGDLDLVLTGWEAYVFRSAKVPWRFVGSRRDEELEIRGARRVTALGRGGEDVLRGTPGPDRLVGGAGDDRAFGSKGNDVCVAVERARSCESTR